MSEVKLDQALYCKGPTTMHQMSTIRHYIIPGNLHCFIFHEKEKSVYKIGSV